MLESRTQPGFVRVLLEGNGFVVVLGTMSCFVPLHWLTEYIQDKSSSRHPPLPGGPRRSIGSIVLSASRED